jgi:hypothetical protein
MSAGAWRTWTLKSASTRRRYFIAKMGRLLLEFGVLGTGDNRRMNERMDG